MKSGQITMSAACRLIVPLCLLLPILGCSQSDSRLAADKSQPSKADIDWQNGQGKPPTERTLFAMAKILVTQGKESEAEFVLKKIIQDYPSFLPAYVELAEMDLRNHEEDAAIACLNRALERSPKDPVLLNDMGMCLLLKKQYAKAAEPFRLAAAAAPENARYRANLAVALGMQGNYDEALSLYEQVLPRAEAHYNMAVICAARKDRDRAEQEFAQAGPLAKAASPAAGNSTNAKDMPVAQE